ncbi:hypothetical protein BD769DRAFT_1662527 [Suillus cothurnatus]|nr:hypothetical protein BD769DRAFT_1662527 [Suillus cothurnatus]
MPPKASATRKHTRITKKRPSCKNAKTIKKPGKNSGLNPSLNSDASQIGIHIEQPQPLASYHQLISLIDSKGMDEDEDEDEDEMEEEDYMEEADEHLGQPGPLRDYPPLFMQSGPPPDSRQFQQQHLGQPGPSRDYPPPFMQPGPPPDSRQPQQQPAPYAHTYGLPQIPFTPPELMSREAHQFDVPTPTTFRNIGHMQERQREEERTHYLGHLPIDLPGIRKVFVYDPRHPPKGHQGQLFPTGVIRATGDITVTAPLPSRRELPPVSGPPSPITTSPVAGPGPVANSSARSHPYAPQRSTNEQFKKMMDAAKFNMCRKVLLENAEGTKSDCGARNQSLDAAMSETDAFDPKGDCYHTQNQE